MAAMVSSESPAEDDDIGQAIPHVTAALSRCYDIPLDATPPSSGQSSIAARGSQITFSYLGSQMLSQEPVEEDGEMAQCSQMASAWLRSRESAERDDDNESIPESWDDASSGTRSILHFPPTSTPPGAVGDNLDAVEGQTDTVRTADTLEADGDTGAMVLGARGAVDQGRYLGKTASNESDFSVADTVDSHEDLGRF
ncbi:hypothetical protein QFC24_006444 [Naganishia onofrii]|uniref:Uncharacterized protein n=1 Tax=Naganishia onofrii TaxID=1851511 RepID=A0ACC2X1A1_9TREE|nr:hypothetical protein QFC24_006444 [Naganishia onofrii]